MWSYLSIVSLASVISTSSSTQDVYQLRGKPDGGYYIQVEIGTPPVHFNVLVDTGSSNFAIAASKNPNVITYFDSSKSSSFKTSGQSIQVNYTQGEWRGILGTDLVKLSGGNLSPVRSNISLIEESQKFFVAGSNWVGILGLGYSSIAIATIDNVPPTTFFDSLLEKDKIPNGFGLQLCGPADGPYSDDIPVGGNLTLGYKPSNGNWYNAEIVREDYYELLITDIRVGNSSLNMSCVEYNADKTIVDSGTTNLRLPDKVFQAFVRQIKATATIDRPIALTDRFWAGQTSLCLDHTNDNDPYPFNSLPVVHIDLLSKDYKVLTLSVSGQQYLRPVESGEEGRDCYKVGVETSSTGAVIGAVIMEGFNVYFDRGNKSVSFTDTACKPRVARATRSTVSGYFDSSYKVQSCLYTHPTQDGLPTYAVALIAIVSFILAVGLGLIIIKLVFTIKRNRERTEPDIDFHDLIDDNFDTERYN